MPKQARMFATLAATGALLAIPAAGFAAKPADPGSGKPADKTKTTGKPDKTKTTGKAKKCAKTHKVGYVVHGTLVSMTADDAATPANEATVTLKVTTANSHAKKSGEIADQDATTPGVQVAGATYTVPATDAYVLKLNGYEGTDTASPGDKVKVKGRIAVTKKGCAAAGTSDADRYATPDVTKVTITDSDPDA